MPRILLILLVSLLATPTAEATIFSRICGALSARPTAHAYCLARLGDRTRCTRLPAPHDAWCQGIAQDNTSACSRLTGHTRQVCLGLASDNASRCTSGLVSNDTSGATFAAFCTALVRQDHGRCSRTGPLQRDCRDVTTAWDAIDEAELAASMDTAERQPAPVTMDAGPSSKPKPTPTPKPDAFTVVTPKGYIARPTPVEDAFLDDWRSAHPDAEATEGELRQKFRSGYRIVSGKEVKLRQADLFKRRPEELAALRRSTLFVRDLQSSGTAMQRIAWMDTKRCPLSFDHPTQYQKFQGELASLLKGLDLGDATVVLTGTATTFYSENPSKPLGHFFDQLPNEPGDLDLGVGSDRLVERMRASGQKPTGTLWGMEKTVSVVTELQTFAARWGASLGRPVNFVAMTDGSNTKVRPTDFIVVKP